MSKLYGYDEKDVLGLSEFIKSGGDKNLSRAFEKYAILTGKAKGTIRNMYYAMVKKGKVDESFKKQYLGEKEFKVEKPKEFSKDEYEKLLSYVISAKRQGKSVRRATSELANGDMKLALRYQNKYRNAVKKDVERIKALNSNQDFSATKRVLEVLPDAVFNKLKNDINALINKLSEKEKRQNEFLRSRVFALETENTRLNNIINGSKNVDFFKGIKKEDVIS